MDASATGDAPLEVFIDGQSPADGDSRKDDSSRKGSRLNQDDLESGKKGIDHDDTSRKGSRSSTKASLAKPFDDDEDGFGIGNKVGKGLAALRHRGDSLSRQNSRQELDEDEAENDENGNNSRKGSRKGSQDLLGRKGSELGSRRNTLCQPVISDKGDGIHEVSYVPPPVGDPYEVRFAILNGKEYIEIFRKAAKMIAHKISKIGA